MAKLLEIRNKSRSITLRTAPIERLKLEQNISKILFYYFTSLEKAGKIKPHSKFQKVVKDLEFIDAKLVQLQQTYNAETQKWNRIVTFPLLNLIFKIFRFKVFEKFKIPQ